MRAREAAVLAREAVVTSEREDLTKSMLARETSLLAREQSMATRERSVGKAVAAAVATAVAAERQHAAAAKDALLRQLASEQAAAATAVELHDRTKAVVVVKKEKVEEMAGQLEEAKQCSVCLERDCDRVLSACGHAFCRQCVDGVVERSVAAAGRLCPTCRAKFTKAQIRPLFV